jgi:DNA-binding LacI/PurR family transcriptional regulator
MRSNSGLYLDIPSRCLTTQMDVSDPPLTTIAFDASALVKLAVSVLLEALGYPAAPAPSSEQVISIIERESTAPST